MRHFLWLLLGLTSIAQAQKYYDKTTINPIPPYSLGTSGLVPTYLNSYTITGAVTAASATFTCVTGCSSLAVGQYVSGSDGVHSIYPATGGELAAVITTIVGSTITTSILSSASTTPGTYTLTIGNDRWSTTATAMANTIGVKNLWVGGAVTGNSTWAQLYLANDCDNPVKVASCILMNSGGTYTNFWGARTSDSATGGVEANISLLVNDNTGTQGNAWNHYFQTELMAGSGTGKQTFGLESSTFNFNSTVVKVDPFTTNVGSQIENVRIDCGQPSLGLTMYPCTDALAILAIGGTYGFYTGINFGSTALDTSIVDHPPAIALPSGANGYGITWYKATGYSTPAWNIYSTSTSQNGNKLDLSDSAATFSVFNSIGTGVDTLGSGSLSLTGNHTGTHGTSGSIIDVDAMTVKDTTSSGTVAQTYVNHIGIPTLSATNATTLTSAHTFVIDGAPVAFTNVTITNPFAFRVLAGASRFDGSLTATAGAAISGATTTINASSNFNTNINTGTSTGAITLGNNGATGSSLTVGSPLTFSFGNSLSQASWTTVSPAFNSSAMTLNDTTASGTVTTEAAYSLQAPTFTSTGGASTTITNASGLWLAAPVCSGGVVCTNLWSLNAVGAILGQTGAKIQGGSIQLNASSNFATSIGTGSTANTVTLGGGSNQVVVNATTFTATGTANINASNNAVTNIGTGTTSSAIHIGDGSGNNAITIGNGTGLVNMTNMENAAGTTFTLGNFSGCSTTNGTPTTLSGGSQTGSFVTASSGTTCSVVITLNGATGATAAHGWYCAGTDITSAVNLAQSAKTTTTCTLKGTVNATTDTVVFHAYAY